MRVFNQYLDNVACRVACSSSCGDQFIPVSLVNGSITALWICSRRMASEYVLAIVIVVSSWSLERLVDIFLQLTRPSKSKVGQDDLYLYLTVMIKGLARVDGLVNALVALFSVAIVCMQHCGS